MKNDSTNIEVQEISAKPELSSFARELEDMIIRICESTGAPADDLLQALTLAVADVVLHTDGSQAANIAKAKDMLTGMFEVAKERHQPCIDNLVAQGLVQVASH